MKLELLETFHALGSKWYCEGCGVGEEPVAIVIFHEKNIRWVQRCFGGLSAACTPCCSAIEEKT